MSNKPCENCGYVRPKDRAPIVHTFDGCVARLKQQKQELEAENARLKNMHEYIAERILNVADTFDFASCRAEIKQILKKKP